MTYEEWSEKYKPIQNDADKNASFDGCLFETYQPHLGEVMNANQKHVWTLVEVDGVMYICQGFHRVNRVGYFITKEPSTGNLKPIQLED